MWDKKTIYEELMTKTFPNLVKSITQVCQENPSTRMKKITPRYIVSKLLKTSYKEYSRICKD